MKEKFVDALYSPAGIDQDILAVGPSRVPQEAPPIRSRRSRQPEVQQPEPENHTRWFDKTRTTAHVMLRTRIGQFITAGLVLTTGLTWDAYHEQDAPPKDTMGCMAGDARFGHDWIMVGNTSNDLLISRERLRKIGRIVDDNFEDNHSWGSIAKLETSRRGYKITGSQLANLNDKLSPGSYNGPACITLPAPGVWGVRNTDGHLTVKEYAGDARDSIEELVKYNPGIAIRDKHGNLDKERTLDQVLPAGFVIKTKAKPDFSLFEQTVTQSFYDIYGGNSDNGNYIYSRQNSSNGIQRGKSANLPPVQTEWMKKHNISILDIKDEYAHSYDTQNLGFQQLAKPKVIKPTLPEVHHVTTTVAASKSVEELQLENYRFVGYKGLTYGDPKLAQYDIKYGHQFDVAPAELMALSIEETADWTNRNTSSTGARGRMQFMPGTWQDIINELGLPANSNRLNPRLSTLGAAAYIHDLKIRMRPLATHKHPLMNLVWDAYNAGAGAVGEAMQNGQNPDALTGDNGHYAAHIIRSTREIESQFAPLAKSNQKRVTTTGQHITEYVDNIKYFSQTDGRYNWYAYNKHDGNRQGSHDTIGWGGCWPSSAAMIASTLTGRNFTPIDMADFAMAHGYARGTDGVETDGHSAFLALGKMLNAEVVDFNSSQLKDMEDFVARGGFIGIGGGDLRNPGSTVGAETPFTSQGHVIFIRAFKNGKFYIGDPAQYVNTLRAYDPQKLIAKGGYFVGIRMPQNGHSELALKDKAIGKK